MPTRRPQSRVVTTPRREYVFSHQATIHDLKAHLQEQLRKELAALQPDSLLNRNVDEIVDDFIARYTLNVPVLDKAGIAEMPRQEIQMEKGCAGIRILPTVMMPRPALQSRLRNLKQENPMNVTHYIGFDVHKKSVSYCVKAGDGRIVEEGKLPATRQALRR